MEDQDLFVDPNYQKGFNGGYTLAKEDRALFDQLMKSNNDHSQYFQGMKAGGREYLKEKMRTELSNDRKERETQKGKDRDREIEL